MRHTEQSMIQFTRSRATILVGAFGSGKTELAVNFATRMADSAGGRATLVDIDILKPMFRSRDLRRQLAAKGVRVVSSVEGYEAVDVPALSPAIYGAIEDESTPLVMDVGGDDDGARALGRFRADLERAGYDMLYVVNTLRPFSSTPEEIVAMLQAVERASRLTCTALVSNANLGAASSVDEISGGLDMVSRVSGELGIPVRFFAVSRRVAQSQGESVDRIARDAGIPAFVIDRLVLPPWERPSEE
ncbi:MAG TPA: hypothetical protein DDZ84_13715 [Firmicutes bacterium]|nr:hypothetical protein [Bacillota bacterium]